MLKTLQENFYQVQIIIGVAFLAITWFFLRPRPPESNFRVREADLDKYRSTTKPKTGGGTSSGKKDGLANARLRPKLSLTGIRIDGPPHEVLGITIDATEEEVKRAYRDLIKRYHPDKVGKPGTREWKDAQAISEKINLAKELMLRHKKKSP